MADKENPGYLITFVKQTSMLGESVQISTNMPKGSSDVELGAELTKMGNALDMRMRALNAYNKQKAGKTLEEVGIDTGTIFLEDFVKENVKEK
jgi:hypothetical protein